jgi:hypothetical protein
LHENTISGTFGDFECIFSSEPSPPVEAFPSRNDDEHSSDPDERLPSPPIIAHLDPAAVADETRKHLLALNEKLQKLRNRFVQENAKIDVLCQQVQAGQSSDKALHEHIWTHEAWLYGIQKNFSTAIQDHNLAQNLHGNGILKPIIDCIDQRQRAVEVALQQGPSEHVENSGGDVIAEVKERDKEEVKEMLPEDRLLRMEDANLEMLELDLPFYTLREPVDALQDVPPIGKLTVPKLPKREK